MLYLCGIPDGHNVLEFVNYKRTTIGIQLRIGIELRLYLSVQTLTFLLCLL